MKAICTVFVSIISAVPLVAAPSDLDLSFGGGTGKVTTTFGGIANAQAMALQKDGKIVVVGTFAGTVGDADFAVARYNSDGTMDDTFGIGGKVTTDLGGNEGARKVAVQGDGKIIVIGPQVQQPSQRRIFAIARYTTNGSLDPTFNGTGKVLTSFGATTDDRACGLAIQSNGKIVVAGHSSQNLGAIGKVAVARYNTDGSLDSGSAATSFNGTGMVTTDFAGLSDVSEAEHTSSDYEGFDVVIQGDGKLVVSGVAVAFGPLSLPTLAMVRYNTNGSVDSTFGSGGKIVVPPDGRRKAGTSIALQSDGKIVVGGSSYGPGSKFFLTRYSTTGVLDTTFGAGTGEVTTVISTNPTPFDIAFSLALQGDGKMLLTGQSSVGSSAALALVRYNADGSLDSGFDTDGKLTIDFSGTLASGYGVALQSDGKIIVAGETSQGIGVARFQGDPDTDRDGLSDIYETGTGIYVSESDTGSNPTMADTDSDGIPDGREVRVTHTNPNAADSDGDGFDDLFEINTGFSPTSDTSTPDAVSSIHHAVEFRFNAANGISYRIESSVNLVDWTTIEPTILGTGSVVTRFYSTEGLTRRYFRPRRN